MRNKLFFRMIVCAVLAIGLVLAGCDNGMNGGGGDETENTGGNGDNTGGNNGGNTGGNGDNTGGNNGGNTGGNGDNTGVNTGGNDDNTGGNNGGNTGGNGDNTGGNGGNNGGNTGGETISKPSVPTGVKATALSSTSIRITWNAVSGATSYKIYSPETSGSASNFVELDT
ncbi:MAG: fibronectin type III domain-containing protein, partial [Treponema sp.]|nr:fibronectin type III domain-containing protein [Treponema sp.]